MPSALESVEADVERASKSYEEAKSALAKIPDENALNIISKHFEIIRETTNGRELLDAIINLIDQINILIVGDDSLKLTNSMLQLFYRSTS